MPIYYRNIPLYFNTITKLFDYTIGVNNYSTTLAEAYDIIDAILDASIVPDPVDPENGEQIGGGIVDGYIMGMTEKEMNKILLLESMYGMIPPRTFAHNRTTNGGIHWWECNKIRKLIANIKNRYGYPVRFYHSMDTFSGVYIWVHQEFRVYAKATRLRWESNPNERWRVVCLQRFELDFWGDLLQDFVNSIPILGGVINTLTNEMMEVDIIFVLVYPNLPFFNTMNDILIFANWEMIEAEFNLNGY